MCKYTHYEVVIVRTVTLMEVLWIDANIPQLIMHRNWSKQIYSPFTTNLFGRLLALSFETQVVIRDNDHHKW